MQILSRATNWIKQQVATTGDDFKEASQTEKTATQKALTASAIGAGLGAVAGGVTAGHEISKDTEFFDWVTEMKPLASSGPGPDEVFASDLGRFQNLVSGHSEGSASSAESLCYLSYLKHQSPKMSDGDLQGIYQSLEGQLGKDDLVRKALNMISAHVDRHGSSPNEAHQEFTNYFGYETDFSKATETFLRDQKLSEAELNASSVQMVKRHTSPIGHLGMVKGVALGIAAGAAVGAATGLIVGVGINLYSKLLASGE